MSTFDERVRAMFYHWVLQMTQLRHRKRNVMYYVLFAKTQSRGIEIMLDQLDGDEEK